MNAENAGVVTAPSGTTITTALSVGGDTTAPPAAAPAPAPAPAPADIPKVTDFKTKEEALAAWEHHQAQQTRQNEAVLPSDSVDQPATEPKPEQGKPEETTDSAKPAEGEGDSKPADTTQQTAPYTFAKIAELYDQNEGQIPEAEADKILEGLKAANFEVSKEDLSAILQSNKQVEALATQLQQAHYNTLDAVYGGTENRVKAFTWAAEALAGQPELKAGLDAELAKGTLEGYQNVKQQIEQLQAKFGHEGNPVKAGAPSKVAQEAPKVDGTVYRTRAQLSADMNDSRYGAQGHEHFTKLVREKLNRTNAAGIILS